MNECLNCHVKVGGRQTVCPICQNKLRIPENGNDHCIEAHWPVNQRRRRATFLYKLQLFLALVAIIVMLGLEFLFEIRTTAAPNWSLVLSAWVICIEILLRYFMNRRFVLVPMITICCLAAIAMLAMTAHDLGQLSVFLGVVFPAILMAVLMANTAFEFLHHGDNNMAWNLLTVLSCIGGSIAYLLHYGRGGVYGMMWSLCLILAAIVLVAVIVFRGRRVRAELERRMDF